MQPTLSKISNPAIQLQQLRIKHSRIDEVLTELDTLIYPGNQDSILVIGPTGVGKTMLAKHMRDSAVQAAVNEMQADAGHIPAVYVEAPSSGEKEFSWRLFFQRILAQLEGELNLPKVHYGIDTASGRFVKPRGQSNNSLAALRTSVERALKERGTRFLVIDEAAHIIRQSSNQRLCVQLDTLKSLTNACGTQIVLVGSYDLYPLVSLSAQLARRLHVLHFERYRLDSDTDIRAFRACIRSFERTLPDLWEGKLLLHADALQENTLGCIGTLSSVLTRAAMLAQQAGKWSDEVLRRALLTDAQHKQILSETLDGEMAINPSLTRTFAEEKPKQFGKRSAA
ncbi:AAA family ATPase [Iodobacter sp. HSC-16F04]|uniref:AAA family ATPase n=1 Tax=Iodobacter violaceini TaxID=3044271 RepID=A0ABX0KL50_9NEIS|nr:TniB family NTP-binding protein [Iodobacter violacea]NHQ84851.1 AAA family ATPase [Iodobacter violacea]